ncbi:MAG: hypothetical protein EA341_06920 [Mongoliibacter sp.]|uniref:hypothetical protein n=1 Tax=Mongoliibacter sp. TaxID=2022438 RepID=UPI0012F048E9|nr:hypothetical protein [Mongoliibacter sp.]TVP50650.1 MAG: hypothetical protein EA341_06920 [Mongoliibacter sp.]
MKNIFSSVSCIIYVTIILLSCGTQNESNEELKDEVIAIHDEVMPKMGELKTLKKNILAVSETLYQEDSVMHAELIGKLESLAERMDQAFDGMFVWMRQYKPGSEDMSEKEYREYLLDQKEKVQKVNADIKATMNEAKVILDAKG